MSGSQPQGQRSGEGTAGLWNHMQDDYQRREQEPQARSSDDSHAQYPHESEQQDRRDSA